MQRRRQGGRGNDGCTSSGLEEGKLLIPANLVLNSGAPIEIEKVGATAEQHMLAIIDNFASAGMLIRRGAAAKIRASLKQRHLKPRFRQGASCGKAGQASSGDCDGWGIWGRWHHTRRFKIPLPRTASF